MGLPRFEFKVTELYEVFRVDAIVVRHIELEGTEVENESGDFDLATETRVGFVKWDEGETGVLVFPETFGPGHHVSAGVPGR